MFYSYKLLYYQARIGVLNTCIINFIIILFFCSLLLGQLLYTLGLIIHLAVHCPLVPVMSAALLDFCWSFKYHSNV